MTKKTLLVIAISSFFLSGCVHQAVKTGPTIKPSPQPTPTSTTQTQTQVESTGDVDKDLQTIDKELESDTDLPALNDADLGL